MPAAEHSSILLRIADLIERDLEKLSRAESIDTGKPLSLARTLDIPRAASNFRFFATAILHTEIRAHVTDKVAFNYTLRQPRGIAGLISPWNLQLYFLVGKSRRPLLRQRRIAKPSELTPMTAFLFCEIVAKQVCQMASSILFMGPGRKWARQSRRIPKIATISFTGGTVTGRKVAEACATLFKNFAQLGGKNPNIIFADADLDAAIAGSVDLPLQTRARSAFAAHEFSSNDQPTTILSAVSSAKASELNMW